MSEKTIKMRPSRVLNKMRSGDVAISVKLNTADPRVVEIAGLCGFDCVWLDMEHVPNTLHDIENQIRAAKMCDIDALVRVKRGSYSDLINPLEMDAAGIMVPHIMNAEDAKKIVHQTRFHPIGRRPLDGGNADGAYCMIPTESYVKQANEQRFVIVQIEDPEPLEELEQIAQIEGIDMLFFGPGDFSQGLGVPGKFDDPRIDETRRRVAAVAVKHGKFAGTLGSVETFDSLVEMGYNFLNIGADVISLAQSFSHIITSLGNKSGTGQIRSPYKST